MDYTKDKVQTLGQLPQDIWTCSIIHRHQGLLLSVPESDAEKLVQRLKDRGVTGNTIGCIKAKEEKAVIIK